MFLVFRLSGLSDPFVVLGVYDLLRLDTYRLQLGDCLSHFQRGFDKLSNPFVIFSPFLLVFVFGGVSAPPTAVCDDCGTCV